MHPIQIYAEERIDSGREANSWEVSLLDSQAVALTSLQRHGEDMPGDSGVSIWGECGGDGWVKSGGVAPLSWGFSVVLDSSMASYIGWSLWR